MVYLAQIILSDSSHPLLLHNFLQQKATNMQRRINPNQKNHGMCGSPANPEIIQLLVW